MYSRKIALFLPSLEGGGAERVFVELANQFSVLGFQVDLVLVACRGPYLDEVSPKVNVVDLMASGAVRSFPRLVRYLRSSRPAALLSGLEHSNVVALLAVLLARTGTRRVVSVRSVPTAVYRSDKSIRRWFMLLVVRILYPTADTVIANSKAVREDLFGQLRVPYQKLKVIYNPLNVEQINLLSAVSIGHPWTASGAPPIVVAVGSLSKLKDFPTLVRAFAIVRKVRDCHLVILGEGRDRDAIEVLIDKLGLRGDVFLPGFVSNPFPWIKRAAVFVSSSLTEGCPNSLMQALACDTAIVSTDCVGGSVEILQHGDFGTLVPTGDAEAMAAGILSTLNSDHETGLVRRANDFALDKIATEYLHVLCPGELLSDVGGQR